MGRRERNGRRMPVWPGHRVDPRPTNQQAIAATGSIRTSSHSHGSTAMDGCSFFKKMSRSFSLAHDVMLGQPSAVVVVWRLVHVREVNIIHANVEVGIHQLHNNNRWLQENNIVIKRRRGTNVLLGLKAENRMGQCSNMLREQKRAITPCWSTRLRSAPLSIRSRKKFVTSPRSGSHERGSGHQNSTLQSTSRDGKRLGAEREAPDTKCCEARQIDATRAP